MTILSASKYNIRSEESSRRLRESRRSRPVLAYGFVVIALGLALSDVCRLALAPAHSPAIATGQQAQNWRR